jgi:hypothetical protein
MQAAAASSPRFVRRTNLQEGEYRKNFRQVDRDAIEMVTSDEACQVTNLMSKVYLRLIDAPTSFREIEGVLRFTKAITGAAILIAGVANSHFIQ